MDYQTPTVGRIVHYVSHGTPVRLDGSQAFGKRCRAAIVTAVEAPLQRPIDGQEVDTVSLCVLNPTGQFFNTGIWLDEGDGQGDHEPGTWHWPERA